QSLQLRWPGPEETYADVVEKRGFDPFVVPESIFFSRTWVLPAQQKWRVLAEIPAASVAESKRVDAGDEWLFSFCRYDYTRGESEPVLSSTSPYAIREFERQQ